MAEDLPTRGVVARFGHFAPAGRHPEMPPARPRVLVFGAISSIKMGASASGRRSTLGGNYEHRTRIRPCISLFQDPSLPCGDAKELRPERGYRVALFLAYFRRVMGCDSCGSQRTAGRKGKSGPRPGRNSGPMCNTECWMNGFRYQTGAVC